MSGERGKHFVGRTGQPASLSAGELVDAVERAAKGTPDGAVVRVFLNEVDPASFRQVGLEQFQEAGELPPGWNAKALAGYVITVATGMAVQAKGGASRQELIDVADMAMKIWPAEQKA